jgi:heme a synthase
MGVKSIWLSFLAFLVFIIVIIGGYTRLSHSGLSIVEWKPITGVFYPSDDQAWEKEFALYKNSPEFKKVNFMMQLEEFKKIFFVEYFHRMIGRLIGLVFLLPMLYFLFTRNYTIGEMKFYLCLGSLILFQGLMGWLMVKSGLYSDPYVSQYRLAAHLILACLILSLLVWEISPGESNFSSHGIFTYLLLLLQIFSGALVAGLHAGLIYNSFPLMDGKIIADGAMSLKPIWKNFFENVILVQFSHRVLAIINFINLLAYCYKLFILEKKKKTALWLCVLVTSQLLIGIFTLLMQVPLALGLLHQVVAVILLMSVIISLKRDMRMYSV